VGVIWGIISQLAEYGGQDKGERVWWIPIFVALFMQKSIAFQ
jgi:hypothetical protein